MRNQLIFLFLFSFLFAGRAFAEPPRYTIKATVDVEQKKITATQTVHFTNNSGRAVNELYFHIYPNRKYTPKEQNFMMQFGGYFKINPFPEGFPENAVQIQSIKHNNAALAFNIEGEDETLLKVPLPEGLSSGQSVEVTIDFSVDIPHAYGRFGWHDKIFALSRWYPILSVLNEKGWNNYPFYPFHRPFFSEAAHYAVTMTVPQDYVVIHSGELKNQSQGPAYQKTLFLETAFPIREFTASMSPDYRVMEKEFQGTTVKSFYLPGTEQNANNALESAIDLMRYYTEQFGPYGYKTFSIAPVHLGYGGEQMSNMVFIDTRVYELPGILPRYLDFLISHEAGHQWFYNIVGIDEYNEMWLEEGVNSFFNLEYLENKYGYNASVVELPEAWSWLFPELTFRAARDTRYKVLVRAGLDRPIVSELSSFQEPSSIFSVTYGKGSDVVDMLQHLIGRPTFLKVFQRVFAEFRHKNISIKDFIKLVEEESQQDLDWFFDQWLYTNRFCDYAITALRGNTLTIENHGNIVMPLEITVEFDDDTDKVINWDGQGEKENILLLESKRVRRVTLDRDNKVLDIDRTNNSWPRKVKVHPVPYYLGLYDVPVFLPDDSYNIVLGPEAVNGPGMRVSFQKPYEQNFYFLSGYEFGESLHESRVGYTLSNVFHSQTTLGFEVANTNDLDDDDDDLVSGKVFVRRELWPAAYGIGDNNDHITFYVVRNKALTGNLLSGGLEDVRNISYLQKDEAIAGTVLHFGRSGPYPDPVDGFNLDLLVENSGHFLGATQQFTRTAIDFRKYHPITLKSNVALRLKYGWGSSNDKNLFQLGGINGLRGFDRKTVRGANAALGSFEYRFTIKDGLRLKFMDNIFGVESIGGVAFFDAGQSWFSSFKDSSLKRNAGFGLRMTVNIASFLEKVIVRADVAQAIEEEDDDPKFWFGINHAF